jgi:hypothetical protein
MSDFKVSKIDNFEYTNINGIYFDEITLHLIHYWFNFLTFDRFNLKELTLYGLSLTRPTLKKLHDYL